MRSFRSPTLTDAESPREEPVTYVGDTATLEGGSRSTGALTIVRVRTPANNRLSAEAGQKGPDILTPRRSSPHCFCAAALVLLLLLVLIARYTQPVTSSVTLPVLFYLLSRKSFILIIVIQKYLTIKSPHVPNGKSRDRVGVGGIGGLNIIL